jgi:predicted nucleic acid-binding protein
MRILVSDTSVIVDLERGGFLDVAFRLPYEFAVPDILYHRELDGHGGDELVQRGLRVEELKEQEIALAQSIRQTNFALSLPDTFAYVLAKERGWTLLTGDGALRALSKGSGIAVHGVLWVLDEMENHECAALDQLVRGLDTIATHPRCRLPRAEIAVRLARWRATIR